MKMRSLLVSCFAAIGVLILALPVTSQKLAGDTADLGPPPPAAAIAASAACGPVSMDATPHAAID